MTLSIQIVQNSLTDEDSLKFVAFIKTFRATFICTKLIKQLEKRQVITKLIIYNYTTN